MRQHDETDSADAPQRLRAKLRRVRKLVRTALAALALGRLLALLLCICALSLLLDRALRLPPAARAVLLVIYVGILAWRLGRELVAPLWRRLPEEQIAMEAERRHGVARDLLSSALELARARADGDGFSPELRAQVIADAAAAADVIVPARLVNWSASRRSLLVGGACLLAGGALAAAWPDASRLWLKRNLLLSPEEWPRKTQLQLLDFSGRERVVPRGEDVQIAVRASGRLPRTAWLRLRLEGGGRPRAVTMKRIGQDVFRTDLKGVRENSTFTVEAGDGRLAPHRLVVAERPRISRAEIRLVPPEYIGEAPKELAWDTPSLEVPVGSELQFSLTCTKPIRWAALSLDGARPVALDVPSARTATTALTVAADARCAFTIRDTSGLDMAEPLELAVRALPDRAPDVLLAADGVGERVTPSARLPLRVRAKDDHGVDRAWVEGRYEAGDQKAQLPPVELPLAEPPLRAPGWEAAMDLIGLGVAPGGRVSCVARARDRRVSPGPNVG